MFQRAIVVDPTLSVSYMGDDKFVQETLIGYKYGSYTKLGLVCERTELYAEEVKQESVENGGTEEVEKMEVDGEKADPTEGAADSTAEDGELPDSPTPDSKPGSAKSSRPQTPTQDENTAIVPVEIKEEKKPEKKGLHHCKYLSE